MASFVGTPGIINRFLGFCDEDDPSNLPVGLAGLCRNSDFELTSVRTRDGHNLQVNGVAAGIQALYKTPVTGLMGLIYTPEYASESFFQLPVLFQTKQDNSAGSLQAEMNVGSGATVELTSALLTPPAGAHMIGTQAYNKGWFAWSNLITPLSNPLSPTPGMGVLNLEILQYGGTNSLPASPFAFDPYGMKPFGWTWLPSTSVIGGEVATPTTASVNVSGAIYSCIQAGVTGGGEPTWPAQFSHGIVTDGTAKWQEATPVFGQVYPCYPPYPSWQVSSGGGSWPSDGNGVLEWIYFVYTYVTASGETDIQKALVGLEAPAISSNSYVLQCPTPPSAPGGYLGNVPTGWNLYIATASAGATGIPVWQAFQKWNPAPLAFATPYTVTQINNNGTAPSTNTAAIVGSGNCDAFEEIDDITFSSGSGLTGSIYELGIRYAAIMFVNRNYSVSGFTQNSTIPVRLYSNGGTIMGAGIPLGPANTLFRIVAFSPLQFDPNTGTLPTFLVNGGGGSSGSQTQTAGTMTPGQWRVIETDGTLNSQWQYVNGQWKADYGLNEQLAPIYTQDLGFGLGPEATITGFQFDLQWLNQGGGTPGTLISAQLNYLGNPIGNLKELNISSEGMITDTYVGGLGDLWGADLTPTILNDPSFGVEFIIQQNNGTNLYIDYAKHTAYFTASQSLSIPESLGTNAGPYFYNGNFNPGPNYFVFPQTTLSDNYVESATVIADNTTAAAHFSYTDTYLIGDNNVTDRLRIIWPYPCVDIYYSPTLDRMIQTGVPGMNGHFLSLAGAPEDYYGDNAFVPTQNYSGERAICARDFRGVTYSLRERSGFTMQIESIDETTGNVTWDVQQRWDKVGPCGPRAVDVCGRFMIFVHRSGVYKYDMENPKPVPVQKEIPRWWQNVNWAYAQYVCVAIDEEKEVVRIQLPVGESTVPNQEMLLFYKDGWETPIHFSSLSGREISVDYARRESIQDVDAFIGLRIERTIPNPSPDDQGDEGIVTLEQSFFTSQFLYASSAPDGAVEAITPGIFHDGENGVGTPQGIDWQYETVAPPQNMAFSKIEGFNLNARGNGLLQSYLIAGRRQITDFTNRPLPQGIIPVRPIALTPDHLVGDTRLVRSKFGEAWRARFTNGKQPDVWAELKTLAIYSVPVSSGRPESQTK